LVKDLTSKATEYAKTNIGSTVKNTLEGQPS
jgi:hypothetical protein